MSPSSWDAVAASPSSAPVSVVCELTVTEKGVSARQELSQSPGRWDRTPRTNYIQAAQPLIVVRMEEVQVSQAQPRKIEGVGTRQIWEGRPEYRSHEYVLKVLEGTRTSPSPVTMSTPTGHPATVGRGQHPQTNNDSGAEYQYSEEYKEEEDGIGNTIRIEESPTPDLQAIMAIIQALVSTVASLQLASGRL